MNVNEMKGCKTPLLDLLRGVPKDAHAWYEHHSTHHQNIPYGRLCNEAADEIERLQGELKSADETISKNIHQHVSDLEEVKERRDYWKDKAEAAESNLSRLLGMFKCPDNPGGFHRWNGDGQCLDCCNYATDLSDATLKAYRTTADCNVSDRLIESAQEKRNDQ